MCPIQVRKEETLVYTDGAPTVPHGTIPQETIPTSSAFPVAFSANGPPESPFDRDWN